MSDYQSNYETFDPNSNNIVNREVLEHPAANNARSHARRIALQVMYEIDTTSHLPGDIIQGNLQNNQSAMPFKDFVVTLVMGTYKLMVPMDTVLQDYAPEWPLNQVAVVDRNILRLALYELLFEKTPRNVVVDEAVWLARLYGADGTIRFVNGVLGTISNNLDDIRQDIRHIQQNLAALEADQAEKANATGEDQVDEPDTTGADDASDA